MFMVCKIFLNDFEFERGLVYLPVYLIKNTVK